MAEHKHGDEDEGRSASKAYETRDVKLRPLVVFTAGITVLGLASYLIIYVLFQMFSSQQASRDVALAPSSLTRPAAPGEERLPPEPRIQVDAAADFRTLHAEEDAILTTYGWVDRNAGVVRLPIDVAMKLVLQQGLPARQPDTASPGVGIPALAAAPKGEQTQKKQTP